MPDRQGLRLPRVRRVTLHAPSFGAIVDPLFDTAFDTLNATVCPFLLAVDVRVGTDLAGTWEDCEPYSPII